LFDADDNDSEKNTAEEQGQNASSEPILDPACYKNILQPTTNPAPQDLQQKNNINLIQMLLGIDGSDNAGGTSQLLQQMPKSMTGPPAPQQQQLPSNSGTSQVIHQQIPKPAHQLNPMAAALMPQQDLPNNGPSSVSMQQFLTNNGPLTPASMLQQQLSANNGWLLANAPLQQQQLPSNNDGFMDNSNPNANPMMFNGGPDGNESAAHASATNSCQAAPPPLSINNSEDLTLVLSAVKETQSNLRTLQPMVMQLGDPAAMEEIAKAFKLTASSSQFVLTSDLPSAYSALNDAWANIKKLENQLASVGQHQGQAHQQLQQQTCLNMTSNINPTVFQGAGMMGQMLLPQAAQNQVLCGGMSSGDGALTNSNLGIGTVNAPPQVHSIIQSNNTYIPTAQAKKKKEGSTKSGAVAMAIKPTGGPKLMVDGSKIKSPPLTSKSKSKSSNKKPSPPSSPPPEKVVDLKDLPPQSKDDPEVMMKRLEGLMERTQMSQKQLQRWDKKNGLPKSHSQTMVNSSRSRKQLQKGVILRKWNGDPLISAKEDGGTSSQGEQHEQTKPVQDQSEQTKRSQEQLDQQSKEKITDTEMHSHDQSVGSPATTSETAAQEPSTTIMPPLSPMDESNSLDDGDGSTNKDGNETSQRKSEDPSMDPNGIQ